jgi:septal ring factor EnvC (AmiA/AmiB activator)
MAERVIHELVDDIDGGTASETIYFAVDGKAYRIDLNKTNAKKFRAAMAPYTSVATVDKSRTAPSRRSRTSGTASKVDNAQATKLREWARGRNQEEIRESARKLGMEVANRGRLSDAVISAAYDAAHAKAATAAKKAPAKKAPAKKSSVEPAFSHS